MDKIFFSLLMILGSQIQICSQASLTGLIIDGETQDPLVSVTVSIKDTAFGTVSDFEGNYQLALKKGDYTVSFTYIGFNTVEKEQEDIFGLLTNGST